MKKGPKTFTFIITSNDRHRPLLRVRLKMNLAPLFEVEPKQPILHGLFDEEKVGSFVVTCHENESFDRFDVVPVGSYADAIEIVAIETLRPGIEYRVLLRAKPTDHPLKRRHRIELRTHYPGGKEPVLPVYVDVIHEPRIKATPAALVVPGSRVRSLEETGDPIVETVTLRHAVEGQRFEIVDAYCDLSDNVNVYLFTIRHIRLQIL